MIKVTADVFSGRPNPTWLLTETEAQPVLKEIALNREVLARADSGYFGLGFRGLIIEFEADNEANRFGLPSTFRIAHGASGAEAKALEIVEQIFSSMLVTEFFNNPKSASALTPLDASLQSLLKSQLVLVSNRGVVTSSEATGLTTAATACFIETSNFNPGFWNDPQYVGQNNCYNYAANRRTNTFAQPGRKTGHSTLPITCENIRNASISDGAHSQGDCVPEPGAPRWFMALAIWPPEVDYHWYRKHTEGYWGHKPGGTQARNNDNSGNVINDPQTADRGNYSDFCGYFYSRRSHYVQ